MTTAAQPTLILTPLHQAAPAAGGTLDVLVRVQAPPAPAAEAGKQRAPLRLAVVIDRSGSMDGEPLQEALRCAEYIAGGLTQRDQLAVVLYDQHVQTPIPLGPAGNAAAVKHALHSVDSGGNTALFAGWQAGAQLLEAGDKASLSRVLLLSDGQANAGLCDQADIEKHCAAWAARGVTTTTVGLGRSFNEELMIGMARAGRGQTYYGQAAKDLHDSFDEELALLQSIFLQRLQVKLVAGQGVVVEPLGIVRQAGESVYELPDVAWGAEAWLLVRLHIAPAAADVSPADKQALLAVALEAQHKETQQPVQLNALLALPRLSAADMRGLPSDETVARRVKEVEFAVVTAQARALVQKGDIAGAQERLTRLEARVASEPWLAGKIAEIRKMIDRDAQMSVKEMRFAANRLETRLTATDEVPFSVSETNSASVPAYLRRKSNEGEGRKPRP